MTSLESQIASRKLNNFNVLRLALALLVIFSHSFPLALGYGPNGDPDPFYQWTQLQISLGTMAVNAFFFISGFLITASWLRSKSVADYLMKRVLRIYPGFIAAMLFSAALVWVACPEFRTGVVHPVYWLWSLLKDLVLLDNSSTNQFSIFGGNPFPSVCNGSIWTISTEFKCYLFLLIIGLFGLLKRRYLMLVAAMLGYEICGMGLFHGINRYDLFYLCFTAGAVAWLWKDRIPFSHHIAWGCLLLLLATSHFRPWFSIIFPVAGGYCLLWLAYGPRLPLANWAEKTDLSYGTYLYAFPLQQVLASVVALRHPWMLFILAAPLSLLFAWLSWNLVEKRFLAMKSRAPKLFTIFRNTKLKSEKDDGLKIHDMATEQE